MRAPSRGVPRDVLATSTSFTRHTSVFAGDGLDRGRRGAALLLFSLPSLTLSPAFFPLRVNRDDDDAALARARRLLPLLRIAADGLLRLPLL